MRQFGEDSRFYFRMADDTAEWLYIRLRWAQVPRTSAGRNLFSDRAFALDLSASASVNVSTQYSARGG